jgi:protein-S-isoprenylcysteine O-methyltransferase Ste14
MSAMLSVTYALAAYVFFLGTFLYTVGFLGNFAVPKTIDAGGPDTPAAAAVAIDIVLLGIFAVQHSVMARAGFKRWWTRIVPPAVERSTYVLFASAALALMLWQWRPLPAIVWEVRDAAVVTALQVVFWLGWGVLLVSTFLINHFELFGLRQVYAFATDSPIPAPTFRTPLFYRYVRHPIYLGFALAFWAAPVMTVGHLLFAAMSTGYILVGIWFEERDLVRVFGDRYRHYRRQVGMLLPWRRGVS